MTSPTRSQNKTVVSQLVEKVAQHKGINPNNTEFCLYDDTDPEALETLVANTSGPFTVDFHIDDSSVTVTKTTDGEITVDVESAVPRLQASD